MLLYVWYGGSISCRLARAHTTPTHTTPHAPRPCTRPPCSRSGGQQTPPAGGKEDDLDRVDALFLALGFVLGNLFREDPAHVGRRKLDARVFFELNGQPRVIRVPNRKIKSTTAARPKAEAGNVTHVGAPMPGVVASVAAVTGMDVRKGDLLLTIEAMKMETGIHAEKNAKVKAVHVVIGTQIDAKDLLVELE